MPPTPLSLSPDRSRPELCRAGAQLRSLLCAVAEAPGPFTASTLAARLAEMDEQRRDLADEERLCVCGHTRGAHLPEANQCAGEAQSVLLLCRCTGFQLNAFEVHPAESSKLSRVVFNGRDITNLLSDGEVYDNDDEFHTWQLRLRLSDDAWEQHVETARQLRRIAEHWPPYVAVIPEGMSAEQWVLKLT
jgi:hypothetical protein